MLSMCRISSRAQEAIVRGIYSNFQGRQPRYVAVANILGCKNFSDSAKTMQAGHGMSCIEGYQGDVRDMSVTEAKHVLRQAAEYQNDGPSVQGAQDRQYSDVHAPVFDGMGSHVSLHGCMQSTVPTPQRDSGSSSGYGSYLNMPGGGGKLMDKYLSNGNQLSHPSRQLSTSAQMLTTQQDTVTHDWDENELRTDPSPQGVQGDNCVSFRLWMENCQRYNLPNCDEQMEALQVGRKTLSQVFLEQQEIIRLVAESYKKKQIESGLANSSEQSDDGGQGYFKYNFEFEEDVPCPQGLQGDDCATYKAWTRNCKTYGFSDCEDKMREVESGRKSLQDIFDEQSDTVKKIVTDYQQKRPYSTSSSQVDTKQNSDNTPPQSIPPNNDSSKLSSHQKLKRAVKEYGATVSVFHIGMALISLGGFYVLVSR